MRSRAPARSRRHEGASSTRLHSPPIPRSHCHPNISTKLHFSRILKPISSQWPLSRIVPSTPLPSSTRRFVPVLVSILCAFAGEAPAAAFPHHPVCCSSSAATVCDEKVYSLGAMSDIPDCCPGWIYLAYR